MSTFSARRRVDRVMDRASKEFDRFVEECEPLLRAVYLIVRDPMVAEDVMQETLLRIARRWPRVRRMRHPGAYARKIAVNLALDAHRARGREGAVRERTGEPEPARAVENGRVEQRVDVIAALSRLSPRARAVIVLRYYGDLTEAEVAKTLGCSVGTVKTTASRALATLREQGAEHAVR
jgi:RNA polymerase sigma-70 factor (sigma-E family)